MLQTASNYFQDLFYHQDNGHKFHLFKPILCRRGPCVYMKVITVGFDVVMCPEYPGFRSGAGCPINTTYGKPSCDQNWKSERENRFHLQDYWWNRDAVGMIHKVSFQTLGTEVDRVVSSVCFIQ